MLNKFRLALAVFLTFVLLLLIFGLYLKSNDFRIIIFGLIMVGLLWLGYGIQSIMIGSFDAAARHLGKKN